jgi:hypothetical protein
MKKTKLIFLLCTIVLYASGQTGKDVKTLLGNGDVHLGYFLNPSCQVSKVAGSTAVLPNIGAGIAINNQLYISFVYKYIATENTPIGEDSKLYLDERNGGIRFEYSLKPEKVVHVNFPIETGVGHAELDLKDSYEGIGFSIPSDDVSFFYLEPGMAVELNIWKYAKFDLSVGYRVVNKVKFRNLTEKDLMGITFSAGLKIGLF